MIRIYNLHSILINGIEEHLIQYMHPKGASNTKLVKFHRNASNRARASSSRAMYDCLHNRSSCREAAIMRSSSLNPRRRDDYTTPRAQRETYKSRACGHTYPRSRTCVYIYIYVCPSGIVSTNTQVYTYIRQAKYGVFSSLVYIVYTTAAAAAAALSPLTLGQINQ